MILSSLDSLHLFSNPTETWVFSLGKFDGFHGGHLRLIEKMKQHGNKIAILSFSNHPSSVLHPSHKVKLLQTIEDRIECAKKAGVDLFILEPFTFAMSQMTYDTFLNTLHEKVPFKHLVLGKEAKFGKNLGGDENHVQNWCISKGIEAHYIKKIHLEGNEISSRTLKEAISSANTLEKLKEVSCLLKRPYTLLARFQRYGNRYALSKHLLDHLILPPIPFAKVYVRLEDKSFEATCRFDPPSDFHLENLPFSYPAPVLEVEWNTSIL